MKIAVLIALLFIFVTPCFADQETQPAQENQSPDQPREYLPGEQVVTPSGQKLKVWSTRGAVPVNKAPEPFKDESLQDDLNVIIDGRGIEREEDRPASREDSR